MNIPRDLKYTKDHIWIKIEQYMIVLGITDYAQDLLGEINCVDFPEKGKIVDKDDAIATIESQKSVFDVLSPVKGEIIDLNPKLVSKPDLINSDPYGNGWMVKMNIYKENKLEDVLTHTEYKKLVSDST